MTDTTHKGFSSIRSFLRFTQHVKKRSRYIWDEETTNFLATIVDTARHQILPHKTRLYRAQRGVIWERVFDEDGDCVDEGPFGYPANRMKPLIDKAREGRANPTGIPVLYVANCVETAISETRPWIGEEISVATFVANKDLKIVDLTRGFKRRSNYENVRLKELYKKEELTQDEINLAVWDEIDNAFSEPVTTSDDTDEYASTQIIAELFKQKGFDGIMYRSQFGDNGHNVALFDLNATDPKKCTPYRVQKIKVEFEEIGNTWYHST
ncbi:MAG TPA: RES family NAD+ phosphorylase [Ochrobactrum intermedium]|uniref:RES family NAD+ phosphorylase n=1 Tax=Brucella intermedia TaxID=94625 RepID=A0A7V6P916_9HYPH|nr:RES family NAD+ phosphorylase [Brucella intermedia]HHV66478.1 RES family NAD+ phosphorylase [Brucella intermedia]